MRKYEVIATMIATGMLVGVRADAAPHAVAPGASTSDLVRESDAPDGGEMEFGEPLGFAHVSDAKTQIRFRVSTLLYSDSVNVPLTGAIAAGLTLGHTLSESRTARTRLLGGFVASAAMGGKHTVAPDDDVLTRTVTDTIVTKSLYVGLSHTFGGGSGAPAFIEVGWLPGYVTRSTNTELKFYRDVPPSVTKVEATGVQVKHARMAFGWQRRALRYWGEVSVLSEEADTAVWVGLGFDLGN